MIYLWWICSTVYKLPFKLQLWPHADRLPALFHMILTRNSGFCPTQHFLVGLSDGKWVCLLWDRSWFYMAVPITTMCPTASYGSLNKLTPPTRFQTPPADAINLLCVQAAESHPTYLLLLCSQPRGDKCSSKQNPIYSHRVSLSQTQWCCQCTRMAKRTKGFWLEFRASFGP